MHGVEISGLTDPLSKVPAHLGHKPYRAFDPIRRIGPHARYYIRARFGDNQTFEGIAHPKD